MFKKSVLVLLISFSCLQAQNHSLSSGQLVDEINGIYNREFFNELAIGLTLGTSTLSLLLSASSFVQFFLDDDVPMEVKIGYCCIMNLFAYGTFKSGIWVYKKLERNNRKAVKRIKLAIENESDTKKLEIGLQTTKILEKKLSKRKVASWTDYLLGSYLLSLAEIKAEIKSRLVQLKEA